MKQARQTTRIRRLIAGSVTSLGLGLALSTGVAAQNQFATSTSYTVLLRTAPIGELRTSTNGVVRANVRAHWQLVDPKTSSTNYSMLVTDLGPVSYTPVGPPIVTHVIGSEGPAMGGSSMDVYGIRMAGTGGATAVAVGGAPANVLFSSPNLVRTTTNQGLNQHANPLGPSDVVVTTTQGSGARSEAFTYQPAFRNLSSGSIDAVLRLEYSGDPGSFYQLWAGGIFPGVAIPIAPFDGSIEVWNPAFELTPLLFSSSGESQVPVYIPNDLSLVGATLFFQGISITQLAPVGGSFTNKLPVTFGP